MLSNFPLWSCKQINFSLALIVRLCAIYVFSTGLGIDMIIARHLKNRNFQKGLLFTHLQDLQILDKKYLQMQAAVSQLQQNDLIFGKWRFKWSRQLLKVVFFEKNWSLQVCGNATVVHVKNLVIIWRFLSFWFHAFSYGTWFMQEIFIALCLYFGCLARSSSQACCCQLFHHMLREAVRTV